MVSRCLIGQLCRWDGKILADNISGQLKEYEIYPICPEMDGGLPCPRPRAEISNNDGFTVLDGLTAVKDDTGRDVTMNFLRGAQRALNLALSLGIKKAILKEKSPSCGVELIYRGRIVCPGRGVTTALLIRHDLEVISGE
jgi:uncharacterized protein YbbK (DUF523 family)